MGIVVDITDFQTVHERLPESAHCGFSGLDAHGHMVGMLYMKRGYIQLGSMDVLAGEAMDHMALTKDNIKSFQTWIAHLEEHHGF